MERQRRRRRRLQLSARRRRAFFFSPGAPFPSSPTPTPLSNTRSDRGMLNASPGADLAAEVDALRAEVREGGESAREAGAGRARRISSTTQPKRLPRPPLSHRLGPPTHAQVAALKEELEAKRVKEVELAAYMEVREKGRGERGERGGARRPVGDARSGRPPPAPAHSPSSRPLALRPHPFPPSPSALPS